MSGAATKGRVDLDGTRQALEQLGLLHAAERLPELLSEAVKQNLATHRFVDQLLAVELSQREERRIKTSLRLSGLPTGQTLANFDFAFQPSIAKSRIDTGHLRLDRNSRGGTLPPAPPHPGPSAQ